MDKGGYDLVIWMTAPDENETQIVSIPLRPVAYYTFDLGTPRTHSIVKMTEPSIPSELDFESLKRGLTAYNESFTDEVYSQSIASFVKNGFSVFAELLDMPKKHISYFLKKIIR